MLKANILGKEFVRVLMEEVTQDALNQLVDTYEYIFIIDYSNTIADNRFDIIDKTSCIVDVTVGSEEVLNSFHKKNRQHIRKADKIEGLTFSQGITNFEEEFKFYKKCENERNWLPVPKEEFKNSIVFTALINGERIAGVTAYTEANMLRLGRIYSTRRTNDTEEISNLVSGSASKKLIYDFCLYAIENGYKFVDLGGIDLDDDGKAGIARFKQSFNPQLKDIKIARYYSTAFQENLPKIKSEGYDLT